jgi:iron complex transport system substrate-binding protein
LSRRAIADRIVSLLPSATEMIYGLGLEARLVGVTHECDYPPAAKALPVLVKPVLPLERMSQSEIDAAVTARLREGKSLYEIDEKLLADLAPDLIITQNLCQVCAPSGNELTQALAHLPKKPDVLWMTPRNLQGVQDNINDLARATGAEAAAARLIADWNARMDAVEQRGAALAHRPRVFCMEWLDPVYCSGHWIPDMVRRAGGHDALGREGADSVRIPWSDVVAFAPEILILMSCGFTLEQALAQTSLVADYEGLSELPAVRDNRVYIVDANAHFARPGPRLVDGAELLSHLITGAAWAGAGDAYRAVEFSGAAPST